MDLKRVFVDHPGDDNQKVFNTIPPGIYDELVQSYDIGFAESAKQGQSLYGDMDAMPLIIQKGHERRISLLNDLPIGDVSDKICVDYGVGSWGFACIFPKLHRCRFAIGIDISLEAIQMSEKVSSRGDFAYGDRYIYFTSRGDNIRLADGSVDVFFAGECIEHIENTNAFLDEVYRVLSSDGVLILTTPNADAYLYTLYGERYAVGPEHVALMSYEELTNFLAPRFDIEVAWGFNGSFYRELDKKITDEDFCRIWTSVFQQNPDLATGIVVMARKKNYYHPKKYIQKFYHHLSPSIVYEGDWKVVPLHRNMTGRMAQSKESRLIFDFSGNGLIVNFWIHDWSGYASILLDGSEMCVVNLYHPTGGFYRLVISDIEHGSHHLEIRKKGEKDPRSFSDEVIVYQIISYSCNEGF